MNYYVIHVLTGAEDDFARRLAPAIGKERLISPKKLMPIRRRGVTRKELQTIFPGYLFIQSDSIVDEGDVYWAIRKTEGFIRFLRQSSSPTPISEKDLALLRRFISFGKVADTSKVIFDENDRIVVVEGPLKGLEGRIVKVNRRKGRARITIDIYDSSHVIDLGFEVVERITSGGSGGHDKSGA
jgi:transcription termination/antitermination protein NusG